MLLENETEEVRNRYLSEIMSEMECDSELLEHYKVSLSDYTYYTEVEQGIALNVDFYSRVVNTTIRRANSFERQWGINTVREDEYLDTVDYDRLIPSALELYKLIKGIVKRNKLDNVDIIRTKYDSLENEIIATKKELEEAKMDMCNNPFEFTEAKSNRIAKLSNRYQDLISNPVFTYYSKAISVIGLGNQKRVNVPSDLGVHKLSLQYI